MQRSTFEYPPTPAPGDLLTVYPDLDPAFVPVYAAALPYTMTSPERMYALWQATRHIARRGVPGAVVECGVWRGGSSMVAALALLDLDAADRELWLYDTFEGMPPPTEADVDFTGRPAREQLQATVDPDDDLVVARASLEAVDRNVRATGYPGERIRLVKGMVEQTIPGQAPERIALLRLDTDWEASTRHELEHLWDRLSPGGILIIDDYGHWAGARAGVDGFFAGRADAPLLHRIDYTGRIAIRPG